MSGESDRTEPDSRPPSSSKPTSRLLAGSGLHATVEPDGRTGRGYVLSIGGAEQSHVDLARPAEVFYEYLRRIANLADLVAAPGEPIRALHLGAGAMTLVRYVQATRPGSRQTAVELERELPDFVLSALPLPVGTDLDLRIGDARQVLAFDLEDEVFGLVVLDVFAGEDAPGHLTTSDFYGELMAALAPEGVLAVNVGDDPPLRFARGQARALASAAQGTAALAPADMFSGHHPGNIVLAGRHVAWPEGWTKQLLAAGPHPAGVLAGADFTDFAEG